MNCQYPECSQPGLHVHLEAGEFVVGLRAGLAKQMPFIQRSARAVAEAERRCGGETRP